MHAGYPIMAFTAAAHELVSVDSMRRGMWGPIHELGHNQQRRCWELPPHTTEGTCNLWSVYVHEQVLGMDRAQVTPPFPPSPLPLAPGSALFYERTTSVCQTGSSKRFFGKPEAED